MQLISKVRLDLNMWVWDIMAPLKHMCIGEGGHMYNGRKLLRYLGTGLYGCMNICITGIKRVKGCKGIGIDG